MFIFTMLFLKDNSDLVIASIYNSGMSFLAM